MDLKSITSRMQAQARMVQRLVQEVTPDQARWRPDSDSWSILEVINHLYDEERHDFRVRLDIILHRPEQPWPKIDPQGWVTARRYNQRELPDSLDNFLKEREASLSWLRDLDSPNWEATYQAPFGRMRAGDMMASWVAHDLLHLRQLVELLWVYTNRQLEPYDVRYAGQW